jgi:SpoVK/Ycf46/Vps4 family AAA+-type ATPase
MDEVQVKFDELVHLIRFGVVGDTRQFSSTARRLARRLKRKDSESGEHLLTIIAGSSETSQVMRRAPVEKANARSARTDLLIETIKPQVPEPSLPDSLKTQIKQLILEQRQRRKLEKAGLVPARTGLFIGPPGVGKTMSAHWIAMQLKRPLYTLNLSATTSSLFGRTGSNLREALEFAHARPSVLLLDEFDAIAKGRNEDDIGEAKRMVTVLLQEIDRWPSHSVLLAASNHGELLDRAVWRRFDLRLNFPPANLETARRAAMSAFAEQDDGTLSKLVAELMQGQPLSDVVNVVLNARKRSILFDAPLDRTLLQAIQEISGRQSRQNMQRLALALVESGYSQRNASELTGVSRDTLRKRTKETINGSN